jgi:hypothetical protein
VEGDDCGSRGLGGRAERDRLASEQERERDRVGGESERDLPASEFGAGCQRSIGVDRDRD